MYHNHLGRKLTFCIPMKISISSLDFILQNDDKETYILTNQQVLFQIKKRGSCSGLSWWTFELFKTVVKNSSADINFCFFGWSYRTMQLTCIWECEISKLIPKHTIGIQCIQNPNASIRPIELQYDFFFDWPLAGLRACFLRCCWEPETNKPVNGFGVNGGFDILAYYFIECAAKIKIKPDLSQGQVLIKLNFANAFNCFSWIAMRYHIVEAYPRFLRLFL